MKIFLAPRSNETSYRNFLSTIEDGIDYKIVEPYLTEEGRKILGSEEKLFAWGTKESKVTTWLKMEREDLALFYKGMEGKEREGKFFYAGRILYKQRSKELSLALWPSKPGERPWACVFFLTNLKPVYIPITAMADYAGYSRNFVVQGFMLLRYAGMQKILEKFGSIDNFLDHYSKHGEEGKVNIKLQRKTLSPINRHLKDVDQPDYKRIAKIIEAELGGIPMTRVAEEFGITRERVRQIYKKATGRGYGLTRKSRNIAKRLEKLSKVAFRCKQCGQEVTYGDRKVGEPGSVFCSKNCREKYQSRNHNVIKICVICGTKFHPYRSAGYPSSRGKGEFCSHKCFVKSGRFHPTKKIVECQVCGKKLYNVHFGTKYCRGCAKNVISRRHSVYTKIRRKKMTT